MTLNLFKYSLRQFVRHLTDLPVASTRLETLPSEHTLLGQACSEMCNTRETIQLVPALKGIWRLQRLLVPTETVHE